MKATKIVIAKHKPSGNIKIYGSIEAALQQVKKTKKDDEFSIYEDYIFGEIKPSSNKTAITIQ